ncbi:O-antigen ligase family protein [Thiothrix unzii]|jgi:O-antigen ligase|uniref:O-antigen ligase family protein n=1 Tax=Thiothrix unzii TaxID=111769 RepID=UPI002A36F19D|nr:O-antigen ligase family protein [Thiothrix unzii]MDX9988564.1 O-antigen ligase family protein [Thiothrix unzii]
MLKLTDLNLWFGSFLLLILPVAHTAGIRAFLLSVFFISALFLVKEWKPVKIRYWFVAPIWILLPFVLLPFSNNIDFSLKEIKREMVYGVMAFSGFFIVTYNEEVLKRWLLFLAVGCLLSVFWALSNYVFYSRDLESLYDWRWHYGYAGMATYMTILLPLFIPAWFLFERYRFVVFIVFLSALWMAIFSSQRAMIFVLVSYFVIFGFLSPKLNVVADGKKRVYVFLAMPLFVLGVFFYFMYERLSILWTSPDFLNSDVRVFQLPMLAVDLIMQNPLVGHGFGRTLMRSHFAQVGFEHPHNILLSYGVELGVFGILIVIALFWSLFSNYNGLLRLSVGNKVEKSIAVAGMMIVVGIFVREQFNYTLNRDLAILFWAVNGMLLGFALRQGERC